jgi:hypothetical protein
MPREKNGARMQRRLGPPILILRAHGVRVSKDEARSGP